MTAEGRYQFATTRWTLVVAAGGPTSPESQAALAALCEAYWLPVYAFVRRGGRSAEDAKDLTQAFFTRVLEKGYFAEARSERGRFRSFLLTCLTHFLANEYDWRVALKRGGGQTRLPLEFDHGERTYLHEPVAYATPEHLYERRWALSVLDLAMSRARAGYEESGRSDLFAALRPYLTGDEPASYAELATTLTTTEGALRVAVHRLRRAFARSLREVVAETVETPEEVESELRYLMAAVSRRG
jgi:DNA-directed RNA polymerase specialized sigma24 family protein